jgi:DNA-binding transcriptional LysR family regulator
VAYGRLVAAGAGIGFVAAYNLAHWPGVRPLLPQLQIPPLPCWLAVHREIRGNPVVRRVFDFLAEAIPPGLALQPSAPAAKARTRSAAKGGAKR